MISAIGLLKPYKRNKNMFAFKLVIFVLILLFAMYYMSVVMHLLGIIRMTKRRITFTRCITPFYYWVADPESYN